MHIDHMTRLEERRREADAELRSELKELRAEKKQIGIPHDAVCFFRDGDKWCCVFGDFVNLEESSAGFSDTFMGALDELEKNAKTQAAIALWRENEIDRLSSGSLS